MTNIYFFVDKTHATPIKICTLAFDFKKIYPLKQFETALLMEFRTPVIITPSLWKIEPNHRILCVGSCFAAGMAQRFSDHLFYTLVNPFGVMYNPASVFHTIERTPNSVDIAIITLGTNRVYILKETEEIVDNCQKQPQNLFREEDLSIEQCADYLEMCIESLQKRNAKVQIIITVSPIRYAKYGFHGSQLSKATLLLAVDKVCKKHAEVATYFPAYEIVNDELRDYRFYQEDMLHPTNQAVDYIWQRFMVTFFSNKAQTFVQEWLPIKADLAHRPFNPDSSTYQSFLQNAIQRKELLIKKYQLTMIEPTKNDTKK